MCFGNGLHAFGRGHQHQSLDIAAAFAFQQINRRHHRAARGQHRVDNQRGAFVHFIDQFFKIRHGLQGFFIALQTHHAHFRAGNQVEHAVQHTQACAQNRHNGHGFAFNALALDFAAPAVDFIRFDIEIARGLIRHQTCQLFG